MTTEMVRSYSDRPLRESQGRTEAPRIRPSTGTFARRWIQRPWGTRDTLALRVLDGPWLALRQRHGAISSIDKCDSGV